MAHAEAAKQMRPPRGAAAGDQMFVCPPFVDAAQCIELLELQRVKRTCASCTAASSLGNVSMHIHLPLWALTSRLLSLEKAAHASRAHLVGWMLRLFISKQPTPWANLSRNTLSEQPRVSDQATALAEKP